MATTNARRNRRVLTIDDHRKIQQKCEINGEAGEDYAPVYLRGKGYAQWSIHVFRRRPTTQEINNFEQTASRVEFKGQKARIEGSQINAAVSLYNLLVARSYDVLVGLKSYDRLDDKQSRDLVDPLVKREAIRELVGEVYAASRMAELEGAEDSEDAADDDKEEHTSSEL